MILVYDCASSQECDNQSRKWRFAHKCIIHDSLHQTKAAFIEHITKAACHASHCSLMVPMMLIAVTEMQSLVSGAK